MAFLKLSEFTTASEVLGTLQFSTFGGVSKHPQQLVVFGMFGALLREAALTVHQLCRLPVTCAALADDERTAFLGVGKDVVEVDLLSGRQLRSHQFVAEGAAVTSIAVAGGDDGVLLCGDSHGFVHVLDIVTLEVLNSVQIATAAASEDDDVVTQIVCRGGGTKQFAALRAGQKKVLLMSLPDLKESRSFDITVGRSSSTERCYCCAFSSDGAIIAVGGQLFDVKSGGPVAALPVSAATSATIFIAFVSPRHVVACGEDHMLRLFNFLDTKRGEIVSVELAGSSIPLSSSWAPSVSSDGTRVLLSSTVEGNDDECLNRRNVVETFQIELPQEDEEEEEDEEVADGGSGAGEKAEDEQDPCPNAPPAPQPVPLVVGNAEADDDCVSAVDEIVSSCYSCTKLIEENKKLKDELAAREREIAEMRAELGRRQ